MSFHVFAVSHLRAMSSTLAVRHQSSLATGANDARATARSPSSRAAAARACCSLAACASWWACWRARALRSAIRPATVNATLPAPWNIS